MSRGDAQHLAQTLLALIAHLQWGSVGLGLLWQVDMGMDMGTMGCPGTSITQQPLGLDLGLLLELALWQHPLATSHLCSVSCWP